MGFDEQQSTPLGGTGSGGVNYSATPTAVSNRVMDDYFALRWHARIPPGESISVLRSKWATLAPVDQEKILGIGLRMAEEVRSIGGYGWLGDMAGTVKEAIDIVKRLT